jgi:hypothetical protein
VVPNTGLRSVLREICRLEIVAKNFEIAMTTAGSSDVQPDCWFRRSNRISASISEVSGVRPPSSLSLCDLKEAISMDTNVPRRIRMKRGHTAWHQTPILRLDVDGQAGAWSRCYAQGRVSLTAIYVI